MGRKTFESFPKLLPDRTHVIITRKKDYSPENTIVVHSMEEALKVSKLDDEAFIIGGGEIYKMRMEHADRIELTRVHGEFEADTHFPEIDKSDWETVKDQFHDKDEKHDYSFTYLTYERKQKKSH